MAITPFSHLTEEIDVISLSEKRFLAKSTKDYVKFNDTALSIYYFINSISVFRQFFVTMSALP